MKVVYVAGPYRADSEYGVLSNIRRAEEIAVKYWGRGYAVICPHKNTSFLGGKFSDQTYLNGDLEFVRRADIIVMCPGWAESKGARGELMLAKALGKKIIYERAR